MRIQEAITMEIKETLITEKKEKEAVMEDRAYKEWREEQQPFGGLEDEQ